MRLAPAAMAAIIHKKEDVRSEYHKLLDDAEGDAGQVVACPFGCTHREIDNLGYCHHLIGFVIPEWNLRIPDGPLKKVPTGKKARMIEMLSGPDDLDGVQRRYVTDGREPLKVGDHLIQVVHMTRRVYRKDAPKPSKPRAPRFEDEAGDEDE